MEKCSLATVTFAKRFFFHAFSYCHEVRKTDKSKSSSLSVVPEQQPQQEVVWNADSQALPRRTESESALQSVCQVTPMHVQVWEAPFLIRAMPSQKWLMGPWISVVRSFQVQNILGSCDWMEYGLYTRGQPSCATTDSVVSWISSLGKHSIYKP